MQSFVVGVKGTFKLKLFPAMPGIFSGRKSAAPPALGHLEGTVMEILWAQGEGCVHDVIERLSRPLAYTTVMTTLDRLFKKGFLSRRKPERAFLYAPRFSRREWERKKADELVAGFLGRSRPASDLLISSLVEAVGRHDEALLDELEKKIKVKRRELERGAKQ
jgi:predicted transcriptional regulator